MSSASHNSAYQTLPLAPLNHPGARFSSSVDQLPPLCSSITQQAYNLPTSTTSSHTSCTDLGSSRGEIGVASWLLSWSLDIKPGSLRVRLCAGPPPKTLAGIAVGVTTSTCNARITLNQLEKCLVSPSMHSEFSYARSSEPQREGTRLTSLNTTGTPKMMIKPTEKEGYTQTSHE